MNYLLPLLGQRERHDKMDIHNGQDRNTGEWNNEDKIEV
jgi:hypothetical protein